ncbi:MAG: transcriptional regulator [Gammaproteobacteria bacterium]|nr:transcriptional regulator [Gammaproteobacteria bacterium]
MRRLGDGNCTGDVVRAGKITVDVEQHRVIIDGELINLSPTEFRLLHFLMTRPDRVSSRNQLLDNVWGERVYIEDRTVDVHIRRLRKILEQYQCDNYISTVRGVGYRFTGPRG